VTAAQVVRVGTHAIGRDLGHGARRAKANRKGVYQIYTPAERISTRRHVRVRLSQGAKDAAQLAAVTGGVAGAMEGTRRQANRNGAHLGAGEQYIHPVRARNTKIAAGAAARSRKASRYAESAGGPRRRAVAQHVANNAAWQSEVYNNRAVHGELRAGRVNGPYDRRRKYAPPSSIGKAEASEISKRPVRPAPWQVRGAGSMTERGGKSGHGYYRPTEQQIAASRERRAAQKAASPLLRAERQFRRKPGVLPPLRSHIKAGPAATVIEGAALAGASALAISHSRKVSKADGDRRRVAAGAVGGVAAADAVSMAGGQAAKAILARRRIARGESPHEAAIWREHKAAHGILGRSTSATDNARKVAAHGSYPKSLPDWRGQRALAFKNKPAVYAATLAAGAA
jgi:hypothetical protein